MRILITGANGLMGRHLTKALSKEHEIIAGSRNGTVVPGAFENRVIPSIGASSDWNGLLNDVDVIIHLAARVHVMNETASDPLTAFREVNTEGAKALCLAAIEQGVSHFIFMSTIKVNGEMTKGLAFDDLDPPAPMDPYGISKYEAEESLTVICRDTAMDLTILRSPVVYGPGVKGNIERIAKLVRIGLPLPLGKVSNRRTMLSLSNLTIWVSRAISASNKPPRPVLIGDPEPLSTRELVRYLAKGFGKSIFLIPMPIILVRVLFRAANLQSYFDRLFGDLEVSPSYNAYPGIEDELINPRLGVANFARQFNRPNEIGDRVVIGVTHHTSLSFHEAIAEKFQNKGYDVHLVSGPGLNADRLSKTFKVHQIAITRNPNPMSDLQSFVEVLKLLAQIRPKIVIFGTPKMSFLGISAAWLLRVPARVYWVHGLRLETARGLAQVTYRWIERLICTLSTTVCAVSPSVRELMFKLHLTNSQKVDVIKSGSTQGVDVKKFLPRASQAERNELLTSLDLSETKFTIGFVGRLTAEKGVIELAKAIRAIPDARERVQLVILGEVEDSSGTEFLDSLRVNQIEHVAVGYVSNPEIYYKGMDLLCLPTYREGLGNVVLEAFACKVPVVTTRVTGVSDLVSDGETGLLVPARDEVSLTKAILKIMEDPELVAKVKEKAFALVKNDFDQDDVVESQYRYLKAHLVEQIC